MKIGKCGFILGLIIGVLAVIACAEDRLPSSGDVSLLSAYTNPALIGAKKIYVIVKPSDVEPDKDGLVWNELRKQIEQRLQTAGLEIVPEDEGKSRDIPEFRVSLEMLKFTQSELYVFRLQLSFATKVYLKQQNVSFKADAWKAEPVIQAVPVMNMPVKVTYAALEQVDAFIRAYELANPAMVQPVDTNDINVSSQQQNNPAIEKQVAEYKYVASKNGKVFHKTNCGLGKKNCS